MSDESEEPTKEYLEAELNEDGIKLQRRGYSFVDEITLSCMQCNKKLVSIMIVQETSKLDKFKCHCPCGGVSFSTKFYGKKYYQAVEPLSIDNIEMNGELTEFFLK